VTGPSLVLEAAEEEDVPALVDLEARCHTHPWNARSFREEVEDLSRGQVLVVRSPARRAEPARGIVAYCVYRVVAGEMHLVNLAVAPEERRQGLASFLLARALRQGRRRGAERVFLEVRRGNRAAQALYERFGFRSVSVRRDYYSDPREDALVLTRPVAGEGREATP